MTLNAIQKLKYIGVLLLFFFFQITTCEGLFRKKNQAVDVPSDNKNVVDTEKDNAMTEKIAASFKNKDNQISINNVSTTNLTSKVPPIDSTTISPTINQNVNVMHIPSINFEAIKRGVFVIMGLSVIVIAYMVFRSFRLNKSRAQMVRKYGVLAHRQDVEMRPLPLDDDDEDDTTVFDASSITSNRLQIQDS